MKLEDQICSLELAKRLKELGVKQESLWYFVPANTEDAFELRLNAGPGAPWTVSAFTVAEIGEMMSGKFVGACGTLIKKEWWVSGGEWEPGVPGKYKHLETAETEVEARAKMLIYLIEQGLVKP